MVNEKLLLGCSDGVRCLNKGSSEVIKLAPGGVSLLVTSVAVYNNILYMLEHNRDNKTVYQCLSDVSQREMLFSFSYSSDRTPLAAVSKDYLVATNPDEKKLVVFNFSTKSTRLLTPSIWPFDLHFLPDGDLLALSMCSNALTRYRIEDDQITTIWSCKGLDRVRNVTSDIDGFIYVSSKRKTIYIISPEGERMKDISNDNLPDICGQISIRGKDELAVPTWRGKSNVSRAEKTGQLLLQYLAKKKKEKTKAEEGEDEEFGDEEFFLTIDITKPLADISGYVIRSLKLKCDDCKKFFTDVEVVGSRSSDDITLSQLKNGGGLNLPSKVVAHVSFKSGYMGHHVVDMGRHQGYLDMGGSSILFKYENYSSMYFMLGYNCGHGIYEI
ncbi:uncharacterized protein [Watersipora subatra]|uniref:uncharacterized protein n=1 Tax=Watersipora subatra TaxID=2589382 RepID=UPI00355B13F1